MVFVIRKIMTLHRTHSEEAVYLCKTSKTGPIGQYAPYLFCAKTFKTRTGAERCAARYSGSVEVVEVQEMSRVQEIRARIHSREEAV